MTRIRQNFLGGETDAALTDSDTTLSSPDLAGMETITAPETMVLVLDPEQTGGDPEIVEVTAHAAAATTATIVRGVENTVARAHASGINWIHTPTKAEIDTLASGQHPVNTVGASGSTLALPSSSPAHRVTMDQNCTFSFDAPDEELGHTFRLHLSGAFTPTFPASVDWDAGAAPTYATPSVFVFSTDDGGTTWIGSLVGSSFS